MHLYRLRHGGASHDAAYRFRGLDAIQKRGSWRSATSVARYAKPARINQQMAALTAAAQRRLRADAALLSKRLLQALSQQ
eukprot:3226497-Heterocapsa_arctica.AAC.1